MNAPRAEGRMSVDGAVDGAVAALRTRLTADQVLTEGPRFEAGTALWNAAVSARPAILVRCATTGDVQTAVRTAREFGLPLSVRGRGHHWAGRALADGGLTIDLSAMREVRVDPARGTATVAGGASANDVLAAAAPYGLVAATGTIGTVGFAGLALGGGYGPLCGRYGLASDNLLGAEVVLADGSVVLADADHEPELLWALRGGGGNFGVVTSLLVRLHRQPTVSTGMLLFPQEQAEQVLIRLGEMLAACPTDLTVQSGMVVGPDGFLAAMIAPTWCGDPAAADAPDGPVRGLTRLGTPIMARFDTAPYATTIARRDAMFPDGRQVSIRSRWLPALTREVAAVLVEQAKTAASPLSALSLHHFHGAAGRTGSAETAFALRTPHVMAEIIAMWEGCADGPEQRAWAEATSAALAPYALPGGYPNLLGPEATDQIPYAYGANTDRLRTAKSAYDPDGVFRATALPWI